MFGAEVVSLTIPSVTPAAPTDSMNRPEPAAPWEVIEPLLVTLPLWPPSASTPVTPSMSCISIVPLLVTLLSLFSVTAAPDPTLSAPVWTMLSGAPAAAGHAPIGAGEAVKQALRHPSYLMLAAGFFVCGFHVAFLAVHLPGVVVACGLPPQWGGWALAMLGLFNIAGSLAIGWAIGRWRMKTLLSLIYAARALAVLVFLFAPKTGTVVLLFAAVMGLTYLSTVPPTAGLVTRFFGPANMATLFGVVMLSHQVGAFAGSWLGGKVFERTGAYDWVWYIDIVLAVGAALVHLPIREAPVAARSAAVGVAA